MRVGSNVKNNHVNKTPKIMPHITSVTVCQSLSLSNMPRSRSCSWKINALSSLSSWVIWLRKVACWPASYLTLAASYQNKNENEKAMANSADSRPYKSSMRVVILAAIPLCTDGNHHADQIDL